MANCTKFLAAQKRHAKKSHPKCRRRGTSPRIPKAVGPKTQYAILRQVVTLIPPEIVHDIDRDVRHRYKGFSVWSHVVALIYQQLTTSRGKTWDSKPRKQGVSGLSEGNFLNSLNVSEADNPLEGPKTQFKLRIATRDHTLVGW